MDYIAFNCEPKINLISLKLLLSTATGKETKTILQITVTHYCNPNSQEAEAGGLLQI